MHPPETRSSALRLVAEGVNDCEISRRLGIPRATIRDWRAPKYVPRVEIHHQTCPRCWRAAKPMVFTDEDYALMLGLYLGDGCISRMGRTYRLRIHLDTKYPIIVAEAEHLLKRCYPSSAVGTVTKDKGSCAVVGVYSNHLPCLFPQHGPGKKHLRSLKLEPWQLQVVDRAPAALLKGLIWSDGCYFVNRTGRHAYPSYALTNRSRDIIELFGRACDLLGVACRLYPSDDPSAHVGGARVNRREAVAVLEACVGIKE